MWHVELNLQWSGTGRHGDDLGALTAVGLAILPDRHRIDPDTLRGGKFLDKWDRALNDYASIPPSVSRAHAYDETPNRQARNDRVPTTCLHSILPVKIHPSHNRPMEPTFTLSLRLLKFDSHCQSQKIHFHCLGTRLWQTRSCRPSIAIQKIINQSYAKMTLVTQPITMPFIAEKLPAATLRQQIASKIRDAVIRGQLKPGEKLVERRLAAQFGTSLTAVREALIQLESEGLITKRTNASTVIVELSDRDIAKIFAVRRVLESYAFAEAARRVTPEESRLLEALHADARNAAETQDADAYVQADLAWHQAVWRIAKNEFLDAALRQAVIPLFGFTSIRVAAVREFDLLQDADSHRALTEAIHRRDPLEAESAFAIAIQIWEPHFGSDNSEDH